MSLSTKGNDEKDKGTSGRAHQRKELEKRDGVKRENEPDRGVSIQTKVQIASVAQNEVGAEMREACTLLPLQISEYSDIDQSA